MTPRKIPGFTAYGRRYRTLVSLEEADAAEVSEDAARRGVTVSRVLEERVCAFVTGGPLPEPLPGMTVDWLLSPSGTLWRRSLVGPCHPPEPDPDLGPPPWRVVLDAGTIIAASIAWTPETLIEVRGADGCVLWRQAANP